MPLSGKSSTRKSVSDKKPTPEALGATWLPPRIAWKPKGNAQRKAFLYPENCREAGELSHEAKGILRELEARASLAPSNTREISQEEAVDALKHLHSIALEAAAAIESLRQNQPALVAQFSGDVDEWPVAAILKKRELWLNNQRAIEVKNILGSLRIREHGARRVIIPNERGSSGKIAGVTRAFAESVTNNLKIYWRTLRANPSAIKTDWQKRLSQLPPLSSKSEGKWWALSKELLNAYWHHQPEIFDPLRELDDIKNREKYSQANPRRDIIDKRIREAFRSVANR